MANFRDQSPVYFTKSKIIAINFGYHPYNETDVLEEKAKHLLEISRTFKEKTGIEDTKGIKIIQVDKSSRFKYMTVVYLLIEENLVHPSIERMDDDFLSFITW